jgi:hypothetical protein
MFRYNLKDAVLDGGLPFQKAHGMTAFEYQGTDPRFNRVFNEAMKNHSTIITNKLLEFYTGFDGIGPSWMSPAVSEQPSAQSPPSTRISQGSTLTSHMSSPRHHPFLACNTSVETCSRRCPPVTPSS